MQQEKEFNELRREALKLNSHYKVALKNIENYWTRTHPYNLCLELNLRVMGQTGFKRLPTDIQNNILARLESVRHKFFLWIAYKKAKIAEKQIDIAQNIQILPDNEFRLIWTIKDKASSLIRLKSECDKYVKLCSDLGLEVKVDLKVNNDESITYNIRVKVCEEHVGVLRARFLNSIRDRITNYIKQGLDPLKIIPNLEPDFLARYNISVMNNSAVPLISIVNKSADKLVSYNIKWAKESYQKQCEDCRVTHNIGLLVTKIFALSIDGEVINIWFLNYLDAESAAAAAMKVFKKNLN